MHSVVDSPLCPDWEWNLQLWHIDWDDALTSGATWPGLFVSFLKIIFVNTVYQADTFWPYVVLHIGLAKKPVWFFP